MSNDISYVIKVADDFSSTLKKYQSQMAGVDAVAMKSSRTFKEASVSSRFFTQNLKDLGKAAGLYTVARQTMQFGKGVFDARIEMDSLQASLAAIMPQFDKTKSGTQLAAEEIEYLKSAADRMGISFQAAAPEYMKFLASSKQDLPTTRKTFEAFAGISRLYGLSASRFGLVINALQQIQGKGVVNMEELKLQLGDSLPNAMNLFADAAGVSTREFYKLVEQGRVGAGILTKVADNINAKFGKDMVAAAQTLGGKTAVLSNQWYYLKTTLSDQVAPVLGSAISLLTTLTTGTVTFFKAIKSDNAMSQMSDEMKILAHGGRIVADVFGAIGEGMSNIKAILSGAWNLPKDLISLAAIKAYQLYGAGEVIAGGLITMKQGNAMSVEGTQKIEYGREASSELLHKMSRGYGQNQKVDVNIKMDGAPKGTEVEVKQSLGNKKLRTGNSVEGGD